MGRCKHTYMVGLTGSDHVEEVRCVRNTSKHGPLCLITDPHSGLQFEVSPRAPTKHLREKSPAAAHPAVQNPSSGTPSGET